MIIIAIIVIVAAVFIMCLDTPFRVTFMGDINHTDADGAYVDFFP